MLLVVFLSSSPIFIPLDSPTKKIYTRGASQSEADEAAWALWEWMGREARMMIETISQGRKTLLSSSSLLNEGMSAGRVGWQQLVEGPTFDCQPATAAVLLSATRLGPELFFYLFVCWPSPPPVSIFLVFFARVNIHKYMWLLFPMGLRTAMGRGGGEVAAASRAGQKA
jgi:hypothetical protein